MDAGELNIFTSFIGLNLQEENKRGGKNTM